MSKVAVIIPTRLNSTRLPKKPLAIVNGKTVIQHVYEHAIKVHPQEDVYIAAGDMEIVEEDLDLVSSSISERDYYLNTNK